MSILNEQSGYNNALSFYNKNNQKKWDEWLTFEKLFKHQGKQGTTCLMSLKEDQSVKYVMKFSKYIDYMINQEYQVMFDLNEIADYCPNLPHCYGLLSCFVEPNKKKEQNPLEITNCKILKDALLIEYIDNAEKLYDFIINNRKNKDILFSIVKQVLNCILLAQNQKHLTHYDLQSNNILVQPCDKDLVFFYIIDEKTYFCVPTRGYFPIIIDFGFSYSRSCENNSLNVSLEHTKLGFTGYEYDEIADPKLFLWTVSNEIKSVSGDKILRNICDNNYGLIDIDKNTGWNNYERSSISDDLSERLYKYYGISKLFKKYENDCLNLIQSLITLPLIERKQDDFEFSFHTFLSEFQKIENEISSSTICLYVLKGVVDAAKEIENEYINGNREGAVNYFRFSILEKIDSVVKFCNPKTINYEKMLCSLFCFKNALEGVLYDIKNEKNETKERHYKKIPLQSLEELVSAIDVNLEDDYVFNENTQILIINGITKTCIPVKLTDLEIESINNTTNEYKTKKIYEIINMNSI